MGCGWKSFSAPSTFRRFIQASDGFPSTPEIFDALGPRL